MRYASQWTYRCKWINILIRPLLQRPVQPSLSPLFTSHRNLLLLGQLSIPNRYCDPNFFTFSTLTKRFFAHTADAISAAYVPLHIRSILTSEALWNRNLLCPDGCK